MEPDSTGKDKAKTTAGLPVYYSLPSQELAISEQLTRVVHTVGKAVTAVTVPILTMFVRNHQHQLPRWILKPT
jgi:hypothetical protein